ncbi:1,3-beta-glucanosyltransferase [Pseudogymnoascus australis]
MAALAFATSVLASAPSNVSPNDLRPRATLEAVTVKGNAFFKGEERFYIRGIDYQPGGAADAKDPLADEEICKRDIAEFKKLGANVVRVYTVDNTKDHTTCMGLLADAGIYLVLDASTPKYSLNRADPKPSYNAVYLQSLFATIEEFAKYTNTLAFFSGNEVINDGTTTNAAPYVKATTRDMRAYIKAKGLRKIPVGYSAADVSENRMEMAAYMNCGSDDERSDFFAFNDYSWCAPNTFTGAGWDQKVKNFTGYGVPIFLSEYGCIKPGPRTFEEVKSLYSTDMTAVYSGGLAYEYSEEGSGYGLVKIKDTKSVSELKGFDYLKKAFASTKSPSGDGGYTSTKGKASECPPKSSNWNVTTADLPTIPKKAAEYMKGDVGKGPGLKGAGSQTAGGDGVSSEGTTPSGSGTEGGSESGTETGDSSGETSESASSGLVAPIDFKIAYVGMVVIGCFFGGGLLL